MTSDNGAQLDQIEQELGRLRAEVERLRAELNDARGGGNVTMKGHLRCPACGCQRLFYASSVLDETPSGRERLSLAQPSVWSTRRVGEFEAFVCAECGLTEWYVKKPEELAQEERLFRLIDGSQGAGTGPYR